MYINIYILLSVKILQSDRTWTLSSLTELNMRCPTEGAGYITDCQKPSL